MAILQPKTTTKTKVLSVRIPADLYSEIESIRQSADAAGLQFCVNDLLADALAKLTRQAKAELKSGAVPARASATASAQV